MSILEWIQNLGWRIAILIAVPIVAGLAAYVIVADEPPDYRATATVNAPAPPTSNPTPSVANQAVANLQALVSSSAFASVVSDDTGVAAATVRSSLVTARVGAGTLVEISATAGSGEDAVAVASSAAHRSVTLVMNDDLAAAMAALELAVSTFERTNQAVEEAVVAHGSNPSVELDLARASLTQAQAARTRAVAAGATDTELRKLDGEIAELESEIEALIPIADEFDVLTNSRSAAGDLVVTATSSLQAIEAVIAAAEASVVEPTQASELSNRVPVARKVATVVVIAGILALMLVIILEIVWPRPSLGADDQRSVWPVIPASDED